MTTHDQPSVPPSFDGLSDDALSDAWESLVRGQPDTEIAPDAVAFVRGVVRDLAAIDPTPPLPAARRQQIWQEVLHAHDQAPQPAPWPAPVSPNGHVADPSEHQAMSPPALQPARDTTKQGTTVLTATSLVLPPSIAPRSLPTDTARRFAFGHLATAALLLLTLAAGWFAIGSPRFHSDDQPLELALVKSTPKALQQMMTETLLQVNSTLPAGPVQLWATRLVMQPGAVTNPFESVETAMLTAEQGTVQIALPDGDRTLHGGESWAGPITANLVLRNVGEGEAQLYYVEVIDSAVSPAVSSANGMFADPLMGTWDSLIQASTTLPGGAARVTLERLTLPPGDGLPPSREDGQHWLGIAEGRLGVTLVGEHLPFRWKSGTERTYAAPQRLPVIPPGTQVTLRNAGTDALVFYRLTIMPGTATSVPEETPTLAEFVTAFQLGDARISSPSGLTVGGDGTLYVIDALKDQIRLFDRAGQPVATWGETGADPGQFRFHGGGGYTSDLAFGPDGNLYVLDAYNSRIQVLRSDGTVLRTWGTAGSAAGQFAEPVGLDVDGQGQVYVADQDNGRVQVFAADGTFLAAWAPAERDGGPLRSPNDVAAAPSGIVAVTDRTTKHIIRFDQDGTVIDTLGGADTPSDQGIEPMGAASDAAGHLFIADERGNRVLVFAPDGTLLGTIGEVGVQPGQFISPMYLALSRDGLLYVSDTGNRRVQVFRLSPSLGGVPATPAS
ncbi:MAG: NHL repeat-containing protein [Thermomicrobiales bacterium]